MTAGGLLSLSFVLLSSCSRPDDASRASAPPSSPSPSTSSAPAPATPQNTCESAEKGLDDFIAALDRTCQKDADCGGFFLHEDVCRGPTMLRVPGCPPARKPLLFAHQGAVRSSCDAGPECQPPPYKAACRGGVCVNALDAGAK
jgi:hypothetical protein